MHGLTGGSWKRSAAPATDAEKNNPGGEPRGAPMASRTPPDPRHRASSGPSTRIRRPRTGKRGISAGQRRESAERRVPLGGGLFRGAALGVPDDLLPGWPAAAIAAFNGHGFLLRKPQGGRGWPNRTAGFQTSAAIHRIVSP